MNENFTKEKIADSVCKVLNELLDAAQFLKGNFTKYIVLSSENEVVITDSRNKIYKRYSLSEVSYILEDRIDGMWEGDKCFMSYVRYLENKIEECYETLGQYGFLQYCKKVYNLKAKTEIAYYKLREFEKMV